MDCLAPNERLCRTQMSTERVFLLNDPRAQKFSQMKTPDSAELRTEVYADLMNAHHTHSKVPWTLPT